MKYSDNMLPIVLDDLEEIHYTEPPFEDSEPSRNMVPLIVENMGVCDNDDSDGDEPINSLSEHSVNSCCLMNDCQYVKVGDSVPGCDSHVLPSLNITNEEVSLCGDGNNRTPDNEHGVFKSGINLDINPDDETFGDKYSEKESPLIFYIDNQDDIQDSTIPEETMETNNADNIPSSVENYPADSVFVEDEQCNEARMLFHLSLHKSKMLKRKKGGSDQLWKTLMHNTVLKKAMLAYLEPLDSDMNSNPNHNNNNNNDNENDYNDNSNEGDYGEVCEEYNKDENITDGETCPSMYDYDVSVIFDNWGSSRNIYNSASQNKTSDSLNTINNENHNDTDNYHCYNNFPVLGDTILTGSSCNSDENSYHAEDAFANTEMSSLKINYLSLPTTPYKDGADAVDYHLSKDESVKYVEDHHTHLAGEEGKMSLSQIETVGVLHGPDEFQEQHYELMENIECQDKETKGNIIEQCLIQSCLNACEGCICHQMTLVCCTFSLKQYFINVVCLPSRSQFSYAGPS